MQMNEAGKELYDTWAANYDKENDRLGGNSEKGEFVDGWCIIDNKNYIHNITDECGIFLFGYEDEAIAHVEELIEMYGEDDICSFDYTFGDLKRELLKYFE